MRVLLCGESWVTHSLHIKGVDSFTTSSYVEGADRLRAALAASGIDADYLPGHLVPGQFPGSAAVLAGYDAVILSDIGANSLLLAPDTFERSAVAPNRLDELGRYVRDGGGLLMIGGYLSFAGIEGKARYHRTAVEDALPVTISETDDRAEMPQGVVPSVTSPGHPVLAGLPGSWPALLGYNRVTARPGATVVVSVGGDPLIACGDYHAGRAAVFTSDCAPHWGPPGFMDWPGYAPLWANLVTWLAGPAGG
ncbi:MAG TPA: glutamine amidotransferase [Streptosporangiaceae bacterium]|nr:glutamine amidotransferase [Streptosporangiaceae bacterium]